MLERLRQHRNAQNSRLSSLLCWFNSQLEHHSLAHMMRRGMP